MKRIIFQGFVVLLAVCGVITAFFIPMALKDTGKSTLYEIYEPLESDPYNISDVENEISEYVYKCSYRKEMILDYVTYSISKKKNSYAEFNYVSDDSNRIMTTVRIDVTNKNITSVYCNKVGVGQVRSMSKGVQYVDVYEIYNNILSDSRYREVVSENDPVRITVKKDEISILNMIYEQ